MNRRFRRGFIMKCGGLLLVGAFGVLPGTITGIDFSHAASLKNTKIDRSLPGAKNGKVTMMTQTAVEIDRVAYVLAPNVRIETQTGALLPVTSSWSKLLHYPVPVRYWATGNQITQMILTFPE